MNKINYFEEQDSDLKLKLTRNISQQKKSLKYSGTTFPNATIFIDDGNQIMQIQSDEEGKYENKKLDNLSSGNFILDYYVIDENGNYFHSSNYKNLDLSPQYVTELQKNIEKTIEKKITKTNKKSAKTLINIQNDIDEEIEYAAIFPTAEISAEMILYQKILWCIIATIFCFATLIIMRKYRIL